MKNCESKALPFLFHCNANAYNEVCESSKTNRIREYLLALSNRLEAYKVGDTLTFMTGTRNAVMNGIVRKASLPEEETSWNWDQ